MATTDWGEWSKEVQSEIGKNTFARYQYRVAADQRSAQIRFNGEKTYPITLDDGLCAPDDWRAMISSAVYRWWQDNDDSETVPGDCVQSPAYREISILSC